MRKRARWPLSIGAKTRVLCSELRRRYAHIDRKFGLHFQFRGRVRFEVSYCLVENGGLWGQDRPLPNRKSSFLFSVCQGL